MATDCTSTITVPSFFIDELFVEVRGDVREESRRDFVNYKRAVWHNAVRLALQSIVDISTTGCWLQCGDGVRRWLFPVILILSADYEEQCDPILMIM